MIKYIGLGFGMAIGGGLVFALFTSELARLFMMFILGAGIVGVALLLNNRQWTQALGMRRPSSTTNRYELLSPSSYRQQQWYNIPDSLPILDSGGEVNNDDPVA